MFDIIIIIIIIIKLYWQEIQRIFCQLCRQVQMFL